MNFEELADSQICAVDSEFSVIFRNKNIKFRLLRKPKVLFRGEVLGSINDFENWHTVFIKIKLENGKDIFINPVAMAEIIIVE
jgi:hypothetical protein